jgi:catechol 2,3-dioxygenase-like lactoylglutathione lyase family enzyme
LEKTAGRALPTLRRMNQHLSYIAVWVHDQDQAVAFYTQKLGFEVRDDVTLEELGGYRWVTVGPPENKDFALALNVPGPPFDADKVEAINTLMAAGMLNGLFFATDDIQASYEQLKSRGVDIEQEPTQMPYGTEIVLRDPSGTSIRFVQAS